MCWQVCAGCAQCALKLQVAFGGAAVRLRGVSLDLRVPSHALLSCSAVPARPPDSQAPLREQPLVTAAVPASGGFGSAVSRHDLEFGAQDETLFESLTLTVQLVSRAGGGGGGGGGTVQLGPYLECFGEALVRRAQD